RPAGAGKRREGERKYLVSALGGGESLTYLHPKSQLRRSERAARGSGNLRVWNLSCMIEYGGSSTRPILSGCLRPVALTTSTSPKSATLRSASKQGNVRARTSSDP